MNGMFRDRSEAGQILAPKLRAYAHPADALVLALPRGGVPVAFQVARKLRLPLDVLVVRKLGVPGQEELAMGAIASGGVEYRDESIIAALDIPSDLVAATIRREFTELKRREKLFRGARPFPELQGKTVIVVDDGIATGSTMRAAFRAVQLKHPKTVIVAAPVASSEAVATLRRDGAEVITVMIAERMFAIGEFYRDFRQTTDEEVKSLLDRASTGPGDSRTAAA